MRFTPDQFGRSRWAAIPYRVLIVLTGLVAVIVAGVGDTRQTRAFSVTSWGSAIQQAVNGDERGSSDRDVSDAGCGHHVSCQVIAVLGDPADTTRRPHVAPDTPLDQDHTDRTVVPRQKPPTRNLSHAMLSRNAHSPSGKVNPRAAAQWFVLPTVAEGTSGSRYRSRSGSGIA